MIAWDLRQAFKKSAAFALGASVVDLAADAIALGINAIVLARNVVRFGTALIYDAARELRDLERR